MVIPVLEMHELCTKIENILDKTVSKWVGNTDSILGHLSILLSGRVLKSGLLGFHFL